MWRSYTPYCEAITATPSNCEGVIVPAAHRILTIYVSASRCSYTPKGTRWAFSSVAETSPRLYLCISSSSSPISLSRSGGRLYPCIINYLQRHRFHAFIFYPERLDLFSLLRQRNNDIEHLWIMRQFYIFFRRASGAGRMAVIDGTYLQSFYPGIPQRGKLLLGIKGKMLAAFIDIYQRIHSRDHPACRGKIPAGLKRGLFLRMAGQFFNYPFYYSHDLPYLSNRRPAVLNRQAL